MVDNFLIVVPEYFSAYFFLVEDSCDQVLYWLIVLSNPIVQ